jgi:DNA-binding response OmpR family regulator
MASTTIVMLTAKAQNSDYGEAEDAGADGYFTKPFSPIALIQKVESVLGVNQ